MRKEFTGVGCLVLKTACDITVNQGKVFSVDIQADKDQLKEFQVDQSGSRVTINQKTSGLGAGSIVIGDAIMGGVFQGVISTGSSTVIQSSGGRINIVGGGEVWVNGQKVNSQPGVSSTPPKIVITTPHSIDLQASFMGGTILALAPFNDAEVLVKGSANIQLAAMSLDASIQGHSDIRAALLGGKLEVDISGSGRLNVEGKFSEASVSISGSGQVNSSGTCSGNYTARVSGSGSVYHVGSVLGKVKERVSGSGRISIN